MRNTPSTAAGDRAISLSGVLIASLVSLTFFEPLANVLVSTIGNKFEPYTAAVSFMILFLVSALAFMMIVVHHTTEWLNVPRWLDIATSVMLGVITGFLLASIIHVFYLMLPFDGDAIRGGIGSGKSTVAALFAQLGAVVIDADAIVHELQAAGMPMVKELAAAFGPESEASEEEQPVPVVDPAG